MFTKPELLALAAALDNLHRPVAVPVAEMAHVLGARQKLASVLAAVAKREAEGDTKEAAPAVAE